MDPFPRRTLGKTGLDVPILGFGGAPLGSLFVDVSESEAQATLQTAWNCGLRYYDSAPWYGHGLSEQRLGQWLRQPPRSEFVFSTKVGRVYTRFRGNPEDYDASPWSGGAPFQLRFDYTYDGIMRSFEDSTMRTGLNRIDLLLIHDLDCLYHESDSGVEAKLKELDSGWKALEQLRTSGEIQGVGAGINEANMIMRMLDRYDLDFFLVAMPYTLLDQDTLDREFPACEERGVGVIVGAPYASGILATGPGPGAKYRYEEPSPEVEQRVARIQGICQRRGVSLKAAALQFPLGHPIVASIIPGSFNPAQARENAQLMRTPIEADFWEELKQEGLLRADAPVPAAIVASPTATDGHMARSDAIEKDVDFSKVAGPNRQVHLPLRLPACVGQSLDAIETPALIVDLDDFERNLRTMNDLLTSYPDIQLRGHAKTHKCSAIARRQVAVHAQMRGVCVQTVSEAEAMVAGGVADVFISNEVSHPNKLRRAARLAACGAQIILCVDSVEQVGLWNQALEEARTHAEVMIEVKVSARGGVLPSETVAIGRAIADSSNMQYRGLHAYHGGAQHVRDYAERQSATQIAVQTAKEAVERLNEQGIETAIVSGGGTGSFEFECQSGVYNEIQCGSYIFNDVDYSLNLDKEGQVTGQSRWRHSLQILASVIGCYQREGQSLSLVDAGLKAHAFDCGPPSVLSVNGESVSGLEYLKMGDEHGMIQGGSAPLKLGSQVALAPGHCDPTVNMYDFILGIRGGQVETIWRVDARGPGY